MSRFSTGSSPRQTTASLTPLSVSFAVAELISRRYREAGIVQVLEGNAPVLEGEDIKFG